MEVYFWIAGITLLAYIIGSYPPGYVLVKLIKGEDIRKHGSGSIGATNVKRILGKKGFIFVMLFDGFAKGLFPVLCAKYLEVKFNLYPDLSIVPILASIGIIMGHSKSIFLGFTGGKSVACGVGSITGLYMPVGFITMGLWAIITYFSKYVSVGSIIAVMLMPILMFVFKQPLSYICYCILAAFYITYLHRENIKRLLTGNENKVR